MIVNQFLILAALLFSVGVYGVLVRRNAVLILSGLSPSAHAASSEADPTPGWWEKMIGPGAPIDTDRFYVIALNSLGSCKGSTGPASENPKTGKIYRLDFPDLCVEDIAASAQQLIKHMGVGQLCTLVGPSMGGMSSLSYLQQFPIETLKIDRSFISGSTDPTDRSILELLAWSGAALDLEVIAEGVEEEGQPTPGPWPRSFPG